MVTRVIGMLLRKSFLVFVFGLSLGCPKDPRTCQDGNIVAKVGEDQVSQSQLLAELARRGIPRTQDKEKQLVLAKYILENLIEERLLYLAASQSGVEVEDVEVNRVIRREMEPFETKQFRRILKSEQLSEGEYKERVKRRVKIETYLKRKRELLPEPTETTIRKRYETTVSKIPVPEQVHVRQVLIGTKEEAEHIYKEIKSDRMNIRDAAIQHSKAPEAKKGGDLGWFSKEEMPPLFDVCFKLKPGQISGVVVSDYGYHIFELIEKRPSGNRPYESIREKIRTDIIREQEAQMIKSHVDKLRKEHDIEINMNSLSKVMVMVQRMTNDKFKQVEDLSAASEERVKDDDK